MHIGTAYSGNYRKRIHHRKIILTGIIGTFTTFIIIIFFMIITQGAGVIFWGVWLFYAGFKYLLILGIIISGSFHSIQWLNQSKLG